MNEASGSLLPFIIAGIAIFLSLAVHEFCHGLVAYLQGDMTAKNAGRLTLNPIAHIDPVGTLLIPALLIFSHAPFMIGWAKPVPFNPHNLRFLRFGPLLVALAGPCSNFLLFLIFGFALKVAFGFFPGENFLILFLASLTIVNFFLALFNLVPLPPLDGSHILSALLPPHMEHVGHFLDAYGPYLMLGVLLIEFSVYPFLGRSIGFLFDTVVRLLGLPL